MSLKENILNDGIIKDIRDVVEGLSYDLCPTSQILKSLTIKSNKPFVIFCYNSLYNLK